MRLLNTFALILASITFLSGIFSSQSLLASEEKLPERGQEFSYKITEYTDEEILDWLKEYFAWQDYQLDYDKVKFDDDNGKLKEIKGRITHKDKENTNRFSNANLGSIELTINKNNNEGSTHIRKKSSFLDWLF